MVYAVLRELNASFRGRSTGPGRGSGREGGEKDYPRDLLRKPSGRVLVVPLRCFPVSKVYVPGNNSR